jgi:hypothetical protein
VYSISKFLVSTFLGDPQTSVAQLISYVTQVVDVESPVHIEDVINRILEAAGVSRRGAQIVRSLENAIGTAVRQGKVHKKGDFLWRKDMVTVPYVRNREKLTSPVWERIASEEIDLAIEVALNNAYGAREEELYSEVCNLLGFGRITAKRRQQLRESIERMIRMGKIASKGEFWALPVLMDSKL